MRDKEAHLEPAMMSGMRLLEVACWQVVLALGVGGDGCPPHPSYPKRS